MCGICGVFEYASDERVDRGRLERMNQALLHRGPDEGGFFTRPHVGLAMRRLRIIDLAGGSQPIANETEDVHIVFNGEIYNYRELRRDLLRRGHRFRTQSDTEVILHLYEEYGERCVSHLDGMFAFAIYDERPSAMSEGNRRGRLFLARDPFGKKPLYYADLGDALIFGSELKPLLEDPRVSREIDPQAVHHYLSLLMIPAPWTIFRGIRKLPAGSTLACDHHGVRTRTYWTCEPSAEDAKISDRNATERIRELLWKAVEKRLVADVPLGAFLSGGLDSSLIVAIMSRLLKEPVRTLSVGFRGPRSHNELPFARQVAEHCRTDHRELTLEPDVVSLVQEVVRFADEPFAISSAVPLLLISRAAREQMTVVLTGDGGDEVFGGYSHYLWEHWAENYRRLSRLADSILLTGASFLGRHVDRRGGALRRRLERFIMNARRPTGARRLGWASGFDEREKWSLYNDNWADATLDATSKFLDRSASRFAHLESAAVQNQLDMSVWLPDEMLAKVDRMTMAASIEARSPLLDRDLVQFASSLSFRQKVPGTGQPSLKHHLRKIAEDLLPADLLKRPKHGFNVPLDDWFRGEAGVFLEDVLSADSIRQRGWFRPEAVRSIVDAHRAGHAKSSNRLYALFTLELWAREHLKDCDRSSTISPSGRTISFASVRRRDTELAAMSQPTYCLPHAG